MDLDLMQTTVFRSQAKTDPERDVTLEWGVLKVCESLLHVVGMYVIFNQRTKSVSLKYGH